MYVFWFILSLLFIIVLIFTMLILSTIKLEIKDFIYDSTRPKSKKISQYKIIIRLKLFNKLTWLKIKITKEQIAKAINNKLVKKIMLKRMEKFKENKNIEVKKLKVLKKLNINTDKLKLYIKLDTPNIATTTTLTTIIATFISIILARTASTNNMNNYRYKIQPTFYMQNFLKICIDCIVSLKMVHIINIIYILKKKRSVNKYDKRTSNRRAYAYSNE